MIIVKVHDKRYHKGNKLVFFDTDTVTEEVTFFVQNHPKAHSILLKDKLYTDRDAFLKEYITRKEGRE